MKGLYGIGLLALGIFLAVMGGFILNAESVTTCSTEWDYVTDVGAAFQGDASDMDVQYNPSENITGWSYLDAYNKGRISGVDFDTTTSTNAYRAVTGDASIVPYSLTLTATDHNGATLSPGYTGTITGYGSYSGNMPEDLGLYNSTQVTRFIAPATTEYGVFGISLMDLASIVPDYANLYTLGISVPMSGVKPCVASISMSASVGQYTHNGTWKVAFSDLYVTAYASTAIVYCKEAVVAFGDTKLPLESTYLIWGQAQFGSTGTYDDSVSVSLTATLDDSPWAYIDAASGVVPAYGSYTTTTMGFVSHPTSSSPTMTMSFDGQGLGTIMAEGKVYADSEEIASWSWVQGGGNQWNIEVIPTGGGSVSGSGSGLSGSFSMSCSGGVFTFDVDGSTGTYASAATSFSELSATVTVQGGSLPWTCDLGRDDGTSTQYTGDSTYDGTMTADLSYITYEPTSTTVSYSTVYWYNGEDNAAITMAFTADSLPSSNSIVFSGPEGDTMVKVVRDSNGVWTVGGAEIGKWTGVQLTVGNGKIVAVPISHFRTFLDYVVVDTETEVLTASALEGVLTSVEVSEPASVYSSLRMCVVSTIVHIAKGGLFIQNGELTLSEAFPSSEAVSVMLGSAAAVGESITFSSGTSTFTIPVDSARKEIEIDNVWYPFNGVTFRWYSTAGSSVQIEGTTYAGAIYHNGQTYEAGKIWAEVGGGKMVEVMEASTDWTMTLDGVWAPSVFFYEGQNGASSTVEIADFWHGEYRWDKETFIIVLMAVSIVGGLVGSYFRLVDLWDWAAIIGTVAVLWIVLG